MKIDRLYAITLYLMNHGKTSASELAKHFEVSVRTIQRDIDALCYAGIPVAALTGISGGYELTDTFRMDKQIATQEDYTHILTALRGLATATNNTKVNTTLEKFASLTKDDDRSIILDFSVLREGDETVLHTLESAVSTKRVVNFTYTNARNETRTHTVEPIAVLYRWYAWYLLAYSTMKNEYRTYKLVRMSNLQVTDIVCSHEHKSVEEILKSTDQTNLNTPLKLMVHCKSEVKMQAIEYLNGRVLEEFQDGELLMELNVIESENFWFGMLLSLGDQIKIVEPERIRNRVIDAARRVISIYED